MSNRPPVPPITNQFPIVNDSGQPTDYFIRWLQERGFEIDGMLTPERVRELIDEWSATRAVNAGLGLSGGGTLDNDLTLSLNAALGDLNDVDLSTPPTNGQVIAYDAGAGLWLPADQSGGGGGGGAFNGARVVRSSTFTPPSGVFAVSWNSASFDTKGFWSAAAPTRLTIPSGVAKIRLSGGIRITGSSSVNGSVRFLKNSSASDAGLNLNSGFGNSWFSISSGVLDVAPGDYFELVVELSSVTGRTAQLDGTFFTIEDVTGGGGGGGGGGGRTAYVQFTGGSPPTVGGQSGISGVTRTNTGRYRITFSTPMPDVYYSMACTGRYGDSTTTDTAAVIGVDRRTGFGKTTGYVDIVVMTDASTLSDNVVVNVGFFS